MTVSRVTYTLKYPPDIEDAWNAYRASCGPCALAAVLNATVMEIRDYLDDGYETRGYMNPTHMKVSLENTPGLKWRACGPKRPRYGLAFLQWGGHEAKPVKVQYRNTHWIAIHEETIFDVNIPALTTWKEWQQTMPRLIKDEKHGDGTFKIRSGIEVSFR